MHSMSNIKTHHFLAAVCVFVFAAVLAGIAIAAPTHNAFSPSPLTHISPLPPNVPSDEVTQPKPLLFAQQFFAFTVSWNGDTTQGHTGHNSGSTLRTAFRPGFGLSSWDSVGAMHWQRATPDGSFSNVPAASNGCANTNTHTCFSPVIGVTNKTDWDPQYTRLRVIINGDDGVAGGPHDSSVFALSQPPTGDYTLNFENKIYAAGDGHLSMTANIATHCAILTHIMHSNGAGQLVKYQPQ